MNQSKAATVLALLKAASRDRVANRVEVEPKPKELKLPSPAKDRHDIMVNRRMKANEGCEKNSIETRVTRRAAERNKLLAELRNPQTVRKAIRKIVFGSKKAKNNGPRWMRKAKRSHLQPRTEGNE